MSVVLKLFTDGRIMDKDDGIIFGEVRIGYDGPRTFTFIRDVRFDEDNIFVNGDKITLAANAQTIFSGWIVDHDPVLSSNEHIQYRAVGPRMRLSGITHTRNGSAKVIYNAEDEEAHPDSTSEWTYGQIFDDIIDKVSNEIVAIVEGTELMTAVAPEIVFNAMSVDDCLRYLVEKAGKFGFYITPRRTLRVVDLSSPTNKNVYVGEIGEAISDHSEYDVMEANLNWSISSCKTKCVIEGARERFEGYIDLVPDWNPELEDSWTPNYGYITPEEAEAIRADENIVGNRADVFRRYVIGGFENMQILDELISRPSNDNRPWVEWQVRSGRWVKMSCDIDIDEGVIVFPRAVYHKRSKFPGTDSATVVRTAAPARIYCVQERAPLRVVFGPTGTAYDKGLRSELYVLDESLVKENVARPDAGSARDDTSKMQTIAVALLAPIKDEVVTGTLSLDEIDLGWSLENGVSMQNTSKSDWSTLNTIILSITYNFSFPEQTKLQVSTSQYLGSGPDYAELKRRLIVAKKISELEQGPVAPITIPGSGGDTINYLNIDDQPDTDKTENKWEASETTDDVSNYTVDEIKNLIQEWFSDNEFTVPKHDHTSASQGGPAYAEKGAVLL